MIELATRFPGIANSERNGDVTTQGLASVGRTDSGALRGAPAEGVGGDSQMAPAQGKAFPYSPSRP